MPLEKAWQEWLESIEREFRFFKISEAAKDDDHLQPVNFDQSTVFIVTRIVGFQGTLRVQSNTKSENGF